MKTVLAPGAPWPYPLEKAPTGATDRRKVRKPYKRRATGPRNLKEKELFTNVDFFAQAKEEIANMKRKKQ